MGKRGPPKTPTRLKVVRGTDRPDRRSPNEPQPPPVLEVPPPPSWLREHGRREWERVVPILVNLRVLTSADLTSLEGYCAAYEDAIDLRADIEANGRTYHTETGFERPRSAVADERKAWVLVRAFAIEFGLTPASRSRVSAAPESKGNDDESFLFGAGA